jgi:hypothetical protein
MTARRRKISVTPNLAQIAAERGVACPKQSSKFGDRLDAYIEPAKLRR